MDDEEGVVIACNGDAKVKGGETHVACALFCSCALVSSVISARRVWPSVLQEKCVHHQHRRGESLGNVRRARQISEAEQATEQRASAVGPKGACQASSPSPTALPACTSLLSRGR